MIKEICIIGHPSYCGGADMELLHQLKCWYKMGIKIYICHTNPLIPYLKNMELEKKYNVTYLNPRQWNEIQGMHCISFCNGEFLNQLPKIKRHAKTTTFVNCMTWNFKKEIEMQSLGFIDFHLYQTNHAFENISKNLKHLGTYRPLMFTPFFDVEKFPYYENRDTDKFRFGRISRCDISKFDEDQLEIYDSINSPVEKSGVIMGWDQRIKRKLLVENKDITVKSKNGKDFEFYKDYIQLLKEGSISQQEFYKFCDVLIMKTNTFENLPRVGMEAMASGSILVVDNKGGWTIEVEDGVTGFLCNDSIDFIERSSLLANNKELKEEIRRSARGRILNTWGFEESAKSWELIFNEWERKS